jgi:hypothetical protein
MANGGIIGPVNDPKHQEFGHLQEQYNLKKQGTWTG